MSSMFEQYDNLSSQYIPSNMNKGSCLPKQNPYLDPLTPKKPYEEINAEGELVGYWWNYGDTINLEFELSGNVTVDDSNTFISVRDFIKDKQIRINIYNFRHEQIETKLFDGNNKQYQSITYSVDPTVNRKTIGLFYTYSDNTYSQVQLPRDYIKDTIYYKEDDVKVIFGIDQAMSADLVKGIYYCSLEILDDVSTITVINDNDFSLTVK